MRIWLPTLIAILLNACSSPAPKVTSPAVSYPKITDHSAPGNDSHAQSKPALPRKHFKPAITYSGIFPKAGELAPAVEFWRNVYVKWRQIL